MAKNPGQLVKFEDGRMGIIYTKKQIDKAHIMIHLIDPTTKKPVLDDKGEQKVVCKSTTIGLTLIGYVD